MLEVFNQQDDPGEKAALHVPEHVKLNKDLLLDKIKSMRDMINKQFDKDGQVEAIVKALKRVEEETLNGAPRRGSIKKSKLTKIINVSKDNIISKKRRKKCQKSTRKHTLTTCIYFFVSTSLHDYIFLSHTGVIL